MEPYSIYKGIGPSFSRRSCPLFCTTALIADTMNKRHMSLTVSVFSRRPAEEDHDAGFRVSGFWFRVEGLGLRVWGLGFRVEGLGFRV